MIQNGIQNKNIRIQSMSFWLNDMAAFFQWKDSFDFKNHWDLFHSKSFRKVDYLNLIQKSKDGRNRKMRVFFFCYA